MPTASVTMSGTNAARVVKAMGRYLNLRDPDVEAVEAVAAVFAEPNSVPPVEGVAEVVGVDAVVGADRDANKADIELYLKQHMRSITLQYEHDEAQKNHVAVKVDFD